MNGLLIAALTASSHANRQWQRSPAVLAMRCSARGYWSKWRSQMQRQRRLLQCTICMQRIHQGQGGADDVNGLLIAALTGLVARQSAVAAKSC